MEQRREQLLPVLAVVTGHAIWGFSYLFTKVGLRYAAPEVLLSIRFLLAFFLMNLPLLAGREKISLRGKPWKSLLALAVMEPLYFYVESYAILYTNATFVGVVLAVVPVFSILLAAIFLREYPTRRQVLFCLLPIAGVIIITISGSSLGIVTPIGLFLLLGTCLTSAGYKTINRRSAEAFTSFERTYFILLSSMLTFTFSALLSSHGQLSAFAEPLRHPAFVLTILALSVLCSVAANILVNYAAGKMSVTEFSVYGTVTTICSTFAGVIFLKEPLTFSTLAGSLLIIIGIRQVTKR